VGLSGGVAVLPRATGIYRFFAPIAAMGIRVGIHLNAWFSLQLGMQLTFLRETREMLPEARTPFLQGFTLDLRTYLARAHRRRPWAPYLSGGLGIYQAAYDCRRDGACGEKGEVHRAIGGGLQLAVGLDVFLGRWFVLGVRASYRYLLMSQLPCPGGAMLCEAVQDRSVSQIHGLTLDLSLAFTANAVR
jgi:hypothetical protein